MNTFTSHSEYLKAKIALSEYEMSANVYRTQNKTNGIPVEICATFPHANIVNNDLRGCIELYEFAQDKPKKYFLYINEKEKKATTWNGEILGNVFFGKSYISNMGDKRQQIDVYAINGVKYYGIYFKSSGNYARIKAYKNQQFNLL